jgi:hypothetical protein
MHHTRALCAQHARTALLGRAAARRAPDARGRTRGRCASSSSSSSMPGSQDPAGGGQEQPRHTNRLAKEQR